VIKAPLVRARDNPGLDAVSLSQLDSFHVLAFLLDRIIFLSLCLLDHPLGQRIDSLLLVRLDLGIVLLANLRDLGGQFRLEADEEGLQQLVFGCSFAIFVAVIQAYCEVLGLLRVDYHFEVIQQRFVNFSLFILIG